VIRLAAIANAAHHMLPQQFQQTVNAIEKFFWIPLLISEFHKTRGKEDGGGGGEEEEKEGHEEG
jgi:hypothetical protein